MVDRLWSSRNRYAHNILCIGGVQLINRPQTNVYFKVVYEWWIILPDHSRPLLDWHPNDVMFSVSARIQVWFHLVKDDKNGRINNGSKHAEFNSFKYYIWESISRSKVMCLLKSKVDTGRIGSFPNGVWTGQLRQNEMWGIKNKADGIICNTFKFRSIIYSF